MFVRDALAREVMLFIRDSVWRRHGDMDGSGRLVAGAAAWTGDARDRKTVVGAHQLAYATCHRASPLGADGARPRENVLWHAEDFLLDPVMVRNNTTEKDCRAAGHVRQPMAEQPARTRFCQRERLPAGAHYLDEAFFDSHIPS